MEVIPLTSKTTIVNQTIQQLSLDRNHQSSFLFDNALIGPDTQTQSRQGNRNAPPVCSARYLAHARQKLQRLMPTHEDVASISSYATPWMSLYYELFPSTSTTPSRVEMVNNHEHMLKPDAEPVRIVTFLMSFAITARQVPRTEQGMSLKGWQDANAYVKAVMTTVDAVLVSHAGIAATVEGLAVIVLYLRLQLGIGQIRPLWLTLRRAVALAELTGLPRARHNTQASDAGLSVPENSPGHTDKVAFMMFNLPAATAAHKFPRKQLLDAAGHVRVQPYMFELAGIAMRIGEIDERYIDGKTIEDVHDNVIALDKELRALKSSTPASWWQESSEYLSASLLVQYWNFYLTLRLHLHAAMTNDEHNIYAYSRSTCLEACHAVCRRYTHVRRALPPGFFIATL
ncbi:hypothetical protein Slin15195_G032380 [Septoria linicola]|uniref:Uncharacterized protein n=1 Tax=Septoria linicola TaxID=215465 RepID=A0A9Q9EHE4_9PEZI|nr:hypothetical protein Slin14017_G031410 [Septoria linicola]USW49919.1 hypothetical protein Slin15195_G032380 [Septoria linicola]